MFESFKKNNNFDEIIIMDWDEVIQCITPKWVRLVRESNDEEFKNACIPERLNASAEEVLMRDTYYLDQWLLGKHDVEPHLRNRHMKYYNDNPSFYLDLPLTDMFEDISKMSKMDFVKEVIILSHTTNSEAEDYRKEHIFDTVIRPLGEKFKLVLLSPSQKKYEWILQNKPNYTCFIDDRIDIVKSVIMNTRSLGKTFLVPEYGYNSFENDEDLITFCYVSSINLSSYKPKKRKK